LCQTLWRGAADVETVPAVARRTEPQLGLGTALREFRIDQQLSQEDLAHRAALHPTWISHLESGRENPSWATVRRLAAALNITLADLAARAEALERERNDASQPG
jgi:transcriptional regulator with XRE-family HTH domain